MYNIIMPISIAIMVIFGIVNLFRRSPYCWIGLLCVGIGLIGIVPFMFARRYLKRKIEKLKEEEHETNDKNE